MTSRQGDRGGSPGDPPPPIPLEELQEMLFDLRVRARGEVGEAASHGDAGLARALTDAVCKLVGVECYRAHRACRRRATHLRGSVCDACGFSYNLYAQELRRLARRRLAGRDR